MVQSPTCLYWGPNVYIEKRVKHRTNLSQKHISQPPNTHHFCASIEGIFPFFQQIQIQSLLPQRCFFSSHLAPWSAKQQSRNPPPYPINLLLHPINLVRIFFSIFCSISPNRSHSFCCEIMYHRIDPIHWNLCGISNHCCYCCNSQLCRRRSNIPR